MKGNITDIGNFCVTFLISLLLLVNLLLIVCTSVVAENIFVFKQKHFALHPGVCQYIISNKSSKMLKNKKGSSLYTEEESSKTKTCAQTAKQVRTGFRFVIGHAFECELVSNSSFLLFVHENKDVVEIQYLSVFALLL